MHKRVLFILLIVLILMPIQGICETIDWKQYSDGLRLAEKQNKKVFLHFRTDWCGYCKKMERYTFKDNEVVTFLNKHFISIKVDGDKEKFVTNHYGVKSFPDTRFLDENKEQIHRLPGFVDPMMFLFFLEYIQTDSYKTMDPMQYYKSK
ncbi:MAG: thioredoxin family protein [Desulfobacteraceae bacterium]|nr:thioredoxin family protein [Desulfobacteraceae bacterium]